MYADISVIVDGAEEETATFYDQTLMDEFVREIAEDAQGHGYPTQIYVVWHDHAPNVECECVQFLTDHRPLATFNARED